VTGSGPPVVVTRDGDVALITLDRPQVRNAIDVETAAGICAAVTECQDAAVIVITGTDPAFCAGLNLRSLGTGQLTDLPPFNATVAASRVPVIAAVNGPAVTGGFELALMADFIVASERAAFADTHLRVGVYPGPVLVDLPRRVGMAWAREMSLTGNFVDAATALRIGIANHVVPHEELLPTAMRLAASIAEADRDMVAAMREDWDATSGTPVRDARRLHMENAREAGYVGRATADGIAARRDAVLDRSRAQRQGLAGQAPGQAGGGDGHRKRMRHGERLSRCRLEDVTAAAQFEDGELGPSWFRVHDPVRRDAELFVRRLLPVQVDQRGARRPNLDNQQRRHRELRVPYVIQVDHHQVRVKLGPRVELDRRLRYNAEPLWAHCAENPVQSPGYELVHRRRPGAHDEHAVHEFIPVAVTGHPVQFGDGERAAEAGPRLVDCHGIHAAPFRSWCPPCQPPPTLDRPK
jgi:enoyl-CoA hydratase